MNHADFSEKEKHAYEVIRQTLPFLDFVKNHPATIDEDRKNAGTISELINKIEHYRASRNWCVRFSLYNEKMSQKPAEGLYRHDWRIALEGGLFSAETEIKHYPFSVKTLKYSFAFYYNFRTGQVSDTDGKNIADFIADAADYKKYMTAKLPDVETAIELF